MKHLMTIEVGMKGVRKATCLAKTNDDINRISVIYNGIKGHINRSGAILCRKIEAEKIMKRKDEVSDLMKLLFGDDFKGLYIASTDDLDNLAMQHKRDKYFRH